jgi:hypothetical protein
LVDGAVAHASIREAAAAFATNRQTRRRSATPARGSGDGVRRDRLQSDGVRSAEILLESSQLAMA